jgi:hypothetical protein
LSVWIAKLSISTRTADKINNRHGISPDQVREAVVGVQGLTYVWDMHPERGLRVLVKVMIQDRSALIVLYEKFDPLGDAWNLGSAYFVD